MNESVRKLIAGLQVIGGAAGAVLVTIEVARAPLRPAGLAVAAGTTTLFLFAVFAGVMLWRDTRIGRAASVICQLVQFPKVIGGGGSFLVSYALDVSVMALMTPSGSVLHFDFRLLGNFGFGGANANGFGLSLTSLACLAFLLGTRRAAVRTEIGSPDAVADFKTTQEAVRKAKAQPVAPPEHPYWVPSWRMRLLTVGVLAFTALVVTCCGLLSFIGTQKAD